MKANNTIIYSQIQAIQPTANMKSRKKDFNKKRNQGVAIILIGVALGAAIHVSIGIVMVIIGFMRIPHIASHVDSERFRVEERWNDDYLNSDLHKYNATGYSNTYGSSISNGSVNNFV